MKAWWKHDWTCAGCGADRPMHHVATSPTAYAAYCAACLPAVLRKHGHGDLPAAKAKRKRKAQTKPQRRTRRKATK